MESQAQLSEEQLDVIHQLLLKSPPGELYVVLEEIKDLLNGVDIPSSFLESTLKEYNLTNNVLVDVEGSKKPLLLVGSLDDDRSIYPDVSNCKCFQFDHLTNVVVQEVEYLEPDCHETMRELKAGMIEEGNKYVNSRFCSRSGFFVGVDGDHMDVIIAGEMIKLRSYYSGRWVSRYSLDVSSDTIHMVGMVDIASHYFENGNVRMEVHKDMNPISIAFEGNQTPSSVFNAIASFEDEVQEGLLAAFSSMKQDSLKV